MLELSQDVIQDGNVVHRSVAASVTQAQLRRMESVTPMCGVYKLELAMHSFQGAVDSTSTLDPVRDALHVVQYGLD